MTEKGVNKDYWALREWGVRATTALKMLGIAYWGAEEKYKYEK